MSSLLRFGVVLAFVAFCLPSASFAQSATATSHAFEAHGGYQFADTFQIASEEPLINAQAGRLTGAFRLMFDNGLEIRTHVEGATANRVTAKGTSMFGTMRFDLGEGEGADPKGNLLYLAYEGSIELQGSVQIVTVEGEFIGGTGRYENATGDFQATSINGFFTNGTGNLMLAAGRKLPSASTAGVKAGG